MSTIRVAYLKQEEKIIRIFYKKRFYKKTSTDEAPLKFRNFWNNKKSCLFGTGILFYKKKSNKFTIILVISALISFKNG